MYFEDIQVGQVERFGSTEVTREEVIAFASRYDPQDFHLDDAAAAQGPFGVLAASGWMTASLTMRMMVEHWQETGFASRGGAGIDELRWTRPVRPGDTLSVCSTVLALRRSASRPEIGLVRSRVETLTADGQVVMTMVVNGIVATRDPDGQDQATGTD